MAPDTHGMKPLLINKDSAEGTDSGYSTPMDSLEDFKEDNKEKVKKDAVEPQKITDPIVAEAQMIALDILNTEYPKEDGGIRWHISKHHSKMSATMLTLTQELLVKHEIVYRSMVTKLKLSNEQNVKRLDIMCDEVFADHQVTWGRIVALYALCVQIARHFKATGQRAMAQAAIEHIGQYIGTRLANWIRQEGGWGTLEAACQPVEHMERKIWKGLLLTGVSLGVLASVISCVR